jgi:membrane-bound serine protease (ClpP class)
MEDSLIVWAVLLITLALVLFFVEMMLPSGGLIGLLAAAVLIGGIVMLFYHDTGVGLIGTIAALVALPFVIGLGFKLLPYTPIFKKLTLSDRQDARPPGVGTKTESWGTLTVGDEGTVLTELRPVGTCRIKGHRIECLADRGIIEPGTDIRVVWIDGMQVKVSAREG